jgi:hypothetical protein
MECIGNDQNPVNFLLCPKLSDILYGNTLFNTQSPIVLELMISETRGPDSGEQQ